MLKSCYLSSRCTSCHPDLHLIALDETRRVVYMLSSFSFAKKPQSFILTLQSGCVIYDFLLDVDWVQGWHLKFPDISPCELTVWPNLVERWVYKCLRGCTILYTESDANCYSILLSDIVIFSLFSFSLFSVLICYALKFAFWNNAELGKRINFLTGNRIFSELCYHYLYVLNGYFTFYNDVIISSAVKLTS